MGIESRTRIQQVLTITNIIYEIDATICLVLRTEGRIFVVQRTEGTIQIHGRTAGEGHVCQIDRHGAHDDFLHGGREKQVVGIDLDESP